MHATGAGAGAAATTPVLPLLAYAGVAVRWVEAELRTSGPTTSAAKSPHHRCNEEFHAPPPPPSSPVVRIPKKTRDEDSPTRETYEMCSAKFMIAGAAAMAMAVLERLIICRAGSGAERG